MQLLLILLIIILIFRLINNQIKKRYYKKLNDFLKSNWGKPKTNEYFNYDKISLYFDKTSNKNKAFHIIDEQIKNDLDLDEVFKFIDRTSSKIGQQYLYYKIRTIYPQEKLINFTRLVKKFQENKKLALQCQSELIKLNHLSNYDLEALINDGVVDKPTYKKYLIPLAVLSLIIIIAGIYKPIFFLWLIPIFLINSILHYKTKAYINYYLSAINQLDKSLSVSKKLLLLPEIKEHFPNISFINKIKEIQLKTKFIGFEKQLSNEILIFLWIFTEIFKIIFNFESIIFYSFIDDILIKNNSIDQMFQFIGEIDSAISVASIKAGNHTTCKPEFINKKQINIVEVTHPLIEKCIPNDIELSNKSLLLTGSNMSGKTTFIRTIAINSILSETLGFAFAKKFEIPFFRVYTSIRISDNILQKTSYFLEEVSAINKLMEATENSSPNLFVLDEIFKGTNTIERISAGKAILNYLNTPKDMVLVSTHDIELTDLLKNNYDLYHFSEQVVSNQIVFDHKIKQGRLTTRNAIKILELCKFPKKVIEDAKKTENKLFKK